MCFYDKYDNLMKNNKLNDVVIFFFLINIIDSYWIISYFVMKKIFKYIFEILKVYIINVKYYNECKIEMFIYLYCFDFYFWFFKLNFYFV